MFKVKIKNFQSIKDLNIDIDGFTVVNGISNIGKSSIVRAIEYLLTSKTGSYFITIGQNKSEVTIEFDNEIIKWISTRKTSSYEINNDRYESVSGKIPSCFKDFGFEIIEVDGKKYNIQVSDQFEPLFILKETGSKIAEVLSVVGNIDYLNKASKICSKDVNDEKKNLRIRKNDKKEVEEKINFFDGFSQYKDQFYQIDINSLLDQKRLLDSYKAINSKIIQLKRKIDNYNKYNFSFSEFDISSELKKLSLLIDYKGKIDNFLNKINKFDGLDFSISDFNIDSKIDLFLKLSKIRINIKTCKDKIERFKNLNFSISNFDPGVEGFLKIVGINNKINKIKDHLEGNNDKLFKLREKLEKIEKDINDISPDICPLCGSSIGEDHDIFTHN